MIRIGYFSIIRLKNGGRMNLNIRKMIALFSLLAVLIPSPCLSRLEEDEEIIRSFMPGVIRRIAVVPCQQVKRGDLLCILEAMKMECSIIAPRDGFIGSLYFTVDQRIENDMPLITILPFMPVEKEGDPMDVDESPLPTSQDNEPSLKDLSQEDISSPAEQLTYEIGVELETYYQEEMLILVTAPITEILNNEEDISDTSSPKVVITRPIEQSVSEDEPQRSQQEETLPLVAVPITEETFDNEGEGADLSLSEVESHASQEEITLSLVAEPIIEALNNEENVFDISPSESVTVAPVEPLASEIEVESQAPQQEVKLPLVIMPIMEILNTEENIFDVSSSSGVIASKEKKSIPEHQAFHQVSTPFWIASVSSHRGTTLAVAMEEVFNNDEADAFSSPQKVKAEEFQQRVNSSKASTHLLWLIRFLLLAFLSFCRSGGIMPYHIRNILTPKGAENFNIPGYLRDAA